MRLQSVWVGIVLSLSACLVHHRVPAFTVDDETLLRSGVLTNYSNEVRPTAVTEVSLLLHVTSIKSVDISQETFALSGWWSMRWSDPRLAWSAATYPSIPVVQFASNKVWTPVLVVSNSLLDLSAIDEDTIPLRVTLSGVVTWTPPALLTTACEMDVTYFPFDTQVCEVEVTSFGFTIQEMDIKVFGDGLGFRYFQANGEWDLKSYSSERSEYSEDGYTYARVSYFFTLKRKPLYYGLNMILPVILCAVLALFVFRLPAESGEKIGYCLTLLLAFMVILTLVALDLPTTATTTSILELYIAIVLGMGGMSVIFSIIVLDLHFLPVEQPITDLVRKLTYMGMKFSCYDRCSHSESRFTLRSKSRTPVTPIQDGMSIKADVNSLDDVEMTWQLVARVLDAVLFRAYIIFLSICTVIVLCVLMI